jgi:biotin carboxyl carrier protein
MDGLLHLPTGVFRLILEVVHNEVRMTVLIDTVAGQRKIAVDGREVVCDWVRLPDGRYSIILNGRVFDLSVELDTTACVVSDPTGTYRLRITDPRRLASRQSIEQGPAGLQRISADMPGKIIRVLVSPGSEVSQDESLLVLEAMKMQNEIRAPKTGVVREIAVDPGSAVSTGDYLLSIE